MKKQIVIALLVGVVLGAGISHLYFTNTDTSHDNGNAQSESDPEELEQAKARAPGIPKNAPGIIAGPEVLALDPASEKEVVKWVKDFQTFNAGLNTVGRQLEPVFWGKGVDAEHDGGDITCGVRYWYVSKSDFDRLYNDPEMVGFKIYPAIREVDVRNTVDNTQFQHKGLTLVFTPTDGDKKTLVDPVTGLIKAFEYVDPCPKFCDPNVLEPDLCDLVNFDLDIPWKCN